MISYPQFWWKLPSLTSSGSKGMPASSSAESIPSEPIHRRLDLQGTGDHADPSAALLYQVGDRPMGGPQIVDGHVGKAAAFGPVIQDDDGELGAESSEALVFAVARSDDDDAGEVARSGDPFDHLRRGVIVADVEDEVAPVGEDGLVDRVKHLGVKRGGDVGQQERKEGMAD